MNVASLLADAADRFGQRPAVSSGTSLRHDFGGLAGAAAGLASGLLGELGLEPGDRVGVFASNRAETVEVMFGIWWAGLVAVPINAKLHPDELTYILDHSGCVICFTSADKTGVARAAAPGALRYIVEYGSTDFLQLSGTPRPVATVEPDHLAWLFYTSGTTGVPKGAMICHRNLAEMTRRYFSGIDDIVPGDALIHAAPMSHGSGMYLLPFVAAGGQQVVPASSGFDPAELFALIPEFDQVSLFAAPTMGVRLIRYAAEHDVDARNLRTIVFGGGPLYLNVIRDAYQRFGPRFAQLYGQGECPMTITGMHRRALGRALAEHDERYLESVGTPFDGVEVRILRSDGAIAEPDEIGEITVRSDAVCLGYWNDEEATERSFRDGWLSTGDLGRLHSDGLLTLGGRSKEMIISGGTNIYPIEVENALLEHPDVAEAAVVGLPDDEWGEIVAACVVPAETAHDALAERLDAHCVDRIARFKRPKRYVLMADLPKNNYGKVVKNELIAHLTTS